MKLRAFVFSVATVVLLCAFAAGRLTGAQEASPAADPFAGIGFEVLGSGEVAELPPAPATLDLIRLTLAPGASLPAEATDPSLALVVVESGELTIAVDVPLTIQHLVGVDFAAGEQPATPREVAAGETAVVVAGESFVGPPFAAGELRNDGTEPVVIILSSIAPIGAEGGEATPTT